MKHLETIEKLFKDLAVKVQGDRMYLPHYLAVTKSLAIVYKDTSINKIASEIIGINTGIQIERQVEEVREQFAVEYDPNYTEDTDCATCTGKTNSVKSTSITVVVQNEQNSIIGDTEISPTTQIENWVRDKDTQSFTAYLKSKGVKVSKKDSQDIDKLIELYARHENN